MTPQQLEEARLTIDENPKIKVVDRNGNTDIIKIEQIGIINMNENNRQPQTNKYKKVF